MFTPPKTSILFLAMTLLATGFFSEGCFGSNPKNEFFYYLTPPKPVAKVAAKGVILAVDDFSVAPGYNKQQIAYRTQANELRYYGYRRWVSAPSKLLKEMVMRHLRASGNFAQVEDQDKLKEPLALLQAHVEALEELDQGDKTYAHLAVRIVVRDASSLRVLFHQDFDKTFPCSKRHPREVAFGVSKLLELEMRQLATRISDALK
ncbi:MAG: membrane integrity-associated transporter subunit PqiC [Deltaproteobacteria bacterium]|nr:membrane integrity-associated transporter subunit PqiC [Deltaproteobacteria bacterium]